jgi:hypothetical protein
MPEKRAAKTTKANASTVGIASRFLCAAPWEEKLIQARNWTTNRSASGRQLYHAWVDRRHELIEFQYMIRQAEVGEKGLNNRCSY